MAAGHYRKTGDTKALDAAKRFADHIDRTFGPGKRYEVCGHQGVESFAFELCLRIPGWARGNPVPGDLYRNGNPPASPVALTINGETLDAIPNQSGYVTIRRMWKTGDVVELNLPLTVNRVYSHESLEENRGRVALMRGPIVYCFEGIDNPGVDLFKLVLPPDAKLTAELRPDLLGGVTVIQTTGLDADGKPVELTAIPYFAWANRGKTPMNIWLHETNEVPLGENGP